VKISEKELKQIIVEALQEEDLDEGIMDKIKGAYGAVKGAVKGKKAATDSPAAPAGKPFPGTRVSPEYQARLMRAATKKYGKEKAERLYGKGTPDTGTPDTGTPDTGTPDTGTPDTGTPEKATAAKEPEAAPKAAATSAATEKPAATPAAAEAKPQINVFRGKGGKGVQSQMAKAGIKGKDIGRVLKGLKSDLAGAGFEVLEELAEAKRREIALNKTLTAIDQIVDPDQKEAAKKIIVNLLKKNKVKVSDARLGRAKPAKPAAPAPAKEPTAKPESAKTTTAKKTAPPPLNRRQRRAKEKGQKGSSKAQQKPFVRKKRNKKRYTEGQELSESQILRFTELAGLL